jgi:hypothetical protein
MSGGNADTRFPQIIINDHPQGGRGIVRLVDGVLAEHWDVLQDEASKESSRRGLPMFGDAFPARQSGVAERPAHRDARAVELHARRDWMSESRPSSPRSSRPDADEDPSRSRPSPKGLLVTLEVPERGSAPSVRKGIR